MYKVAGREKRQTDTHKVGGAPGWGSSCWPGECQRVGGILAPGVRRRGGLRLAVFEIESGLARELEGLKSRAMALSGSRAQRDFFEKGNCGALDRVLACAAARPSRMGDCGHG